MFTIDELWQDFKRYSQQSGENDPTKSEKMFRYYLDKASNKNTFDFGQHDSREVCYFSMTPKYTLSTEG